MKKIILTGGGTAGHVTPNIAIGEALKKENYKLVYIGSKQGIEKDIVNKFNIEYKGISSGKLRRYLSFKNITDMFKIVKGLSEAIKIIRKEKPNIIFSKGGFVTVPVVLAGRLCKVPVIIHESDITPGLANRISIPYSTKVCVTFKETLKYVPKNKSILTGSPIRQSIFNGNKENGYRLTNLKKDKPILLVIGGSLGSKFLNDIIRNNLNELLKKYYIVHICGKNNLDKTITSAGYIQFEYVSEKLEDLIAMCSIVISRAGSNTIYEFLALKKPNILIPLSKNASRGDQILNATSFKNQNFSYVIEEEHLNIKSLITALNYMEENKNIYIQNMMNCKLEKGVENIVKIIKEIIE